MELEHFVNILLFGVSVLKKSKLGQTRVQVKPMESMHGSNSDSHDLCNFEVEKASIGIAVGIFCEVNAHMAVNRPKSIFPSYMY